MLIGVVGTNFKTSPLALREAIARGAQSLEGEKRIFFSHPTVLLSTCNRTEIYFSSADLAAAQSDLLAFLRCYIQEPFEQQLYSYFGMDCFAHLSRVAAGLDSAIVAETEIQRQVKLAYARSCAVLALPGCLHYLFQKALQVAKAIRNLNMPKETPSLFTTMWEIGQKQWEDLKDRAFLLVGYSEIHRQFASFLEHKGAHRITFCTRHPSLILGSAQRRDRGELSRWKEYDLISCASQSDEFLIRGPGPGKKRHLIFDLSVPRNVDPEVEDQNVILYNIDQLQKKSTQTESKRLMEEVLCEKVSLFTRLYNEKTARTRALKLRVAGESGEGDCVADVLHARGK